MLKLGKLMTGDEEAGACSVLDKAQSPLLPGPRDKPPTPLWDSPDTPLPPRYRLRDLLLGDFAFNDDGER